MRPARFFGVVLAVTIVVVAARAPAHAETAGTIQYTPPWPSASSKAPGATFAEPGSPSMIVVEGPYEAESAQAAVRRAWPTGGKIVNEMDVAVAGQVGYLAVRIKGKQHVASAATLVDGQAWIFTVVSDEASFTGAVDLWGAMIDGAGVDGARVKLAAVAAAPTEGARTYPVTLSNGSGDCSATLSIDGETTVLGPNEKRAIQLPGGKHTVAWQNRDGSTGKTTYTVPDFWIFSGNCVPPTARAAPAAAAPELGAEEIRAAAAAWTSLYYVCLNLMSYSTMWGDKRDFAVPELTEHLIAAATADATIASELVQLAGAHRRLVDRWNAGGEAERYQLQRSAAQFAMASSSPAAQANLWGQNECAWSDDKVGCMIETATERARVLAAALERLPAARQKGFLAQERYKIESATKHYDFQTGIKAGSLNALTW